VHGEYSFLCEHARLAKETAGIRNVSVIKNGTMLGVQQLRNAATVSTGSAAKVVGEVREQVDQPG
jgi:mRNA degradation ribonuclease J1/J2